MRPGYDVIVPIHEGAAVLEATLDRLADHSSHDERFLLVDDASEDPRVLDLVAARLADTRFRALRLDRNEGFVAAANRGFSATLRDVVLLNSDAWVTAGWLDRLHECRASSPRIAAACPLSDNATLLTIPGLRRAGAPGLDEVARAVARAARGRFERLPTAHGFCMLVTREALERVGGFDPAFGRGYGEENDWSMRALRAGFEIACAEGAFVSHVGEASFGHDEGTARLRKRNAALLAARWPGHDEGVSQWCRRNPLRGAFERVHRELALARSGAKPRLLLVGYRYGEAGGIEEHLRRTLPFLARSFDTTVLALRRLGDAWADAIDAADPSGARVLLARAESILASRRIVGLAASLRDEAAERFFETVVAAGRYDLVHFHSLVGWGSFELPAIARRHGARVLASVHDLFLQCPDYNMVGPDGRPCGKARASDGDPACARCLAPKEQLRLGAPAPGSLAGFLRDRAGAVERALLACERIVAPSRFAAEKLARAFPAAAGRTAVIAHGVSFADKLPPPQLSSTLRVAFIGRFGPRKGAAVLLEAASRLAGEMIEFTVHGAVDPGLPALREGAAVRFAGPYRNEDLPALLAQVDVVVVPSIVEESYCLTLSEAQALGVPVVASPVGAIAERLEDGRTGFAFAPGDAAALAALLRRLARGLSVLDEVRLNLKRIPARTDAECAADYVAVYEGMLGGRDGGAGAAPTPGDEGRWWLPLLRLDEGPARPPAREAARCPPCLPVQVLVRGRIDDKACLQRTLASLEPAQGPLLAVTVAGERHARPHGAGALLVLEAGDEVEPDLLAEGTRLLAEDPECRLVAFDDDRVSTGGERYGERLRPGINHAALACGASLGRAIVRAGATGEGLPHAECGALALRLLAERGAGAVRHVPRVLCHVTDMGAEEGAGSEADAAASLGRLAVIVYCDEARPANAAAAHAWLDARWGGRVQVALLDGQAQVVTVANGNGGVPGDVQSVDLRGARDLATRLDRLIAELRADTILVQSDRIAWPDVQSPSRVLAAVAAAGVALACPVVLYPDGRVHHAGYVLGSGPAGIAGNLLEGRRWGRPLPAPFDSPRRDVSAIGGIAFALRRDAWEFAGEQAEPATFEMTMVARCLRYAERGWRMVACLDSPAVLAEAQARPLEAPAPPSMRAAFLDRWLPRLARDPCHHPRLSLNPPWRRDDAFAAPWAARPATGRKVVAFPFDDWGSGHYRVRGPMAALAKAGRVEAAIMPGHASGLAPTVAEMARLAPEAILAHDFLHDYQLAALADYARHLPAVRVFGLDDLLTALPSANPYSRTLYPDIAARIRRALALCDRLVVTTPALAEAFGSLCADTRVIPNRLERGRWTGLPGRQRPAGGRPRVGWAGARQHEGDLAWLEPVLRATKDVVDWVFLGMCPDALRPYAAEVHPMVPFDRYPATLAGLALDFAVAPLEAHPFNEAKSALRVLEYGILGLPVIASDCAPYRVAPVCRLPNEVPAWIDAVRDRAGDPGAATREGEALRQWVLTNAMLEDHLEEWQSALAPRSETTVSRPAG